MRNLFQVLILVLFSLCVTNVSAMAETMHLNHQGRLLDNAGAPVTGPVNMTFSIYSEATGGTPHWSEDLNMVAVDDGLFNVILGQVTPLPSELFADNPSLWLGVAIDPEAEMTPRVFLTSVPKAAFALSIPGLDPGPGNVDNSNFSFISGDSNTILSDYSAIVGGEHNVIEVLNFADTTLDTLPGPTRFLTASEAKAIHTAFGAFVGGGIGNHAHGAYSGIYGGAYDSAMAAYSAIEAGYRNTVEASGTASTIKGGALNRVRARYSVIVNGYLNVASSPGGIPHVATTIGGGGRNLTDNHYTAVGGGYGNVASGFSSVVDGGIFNTASSSYATVGGGRDNDATADFSTTSGGNLNVASSDYTTIAGGAGNNAIGRFSAISGGDKHFANGDWTSVGGGSSHIVNGVGSTVGGGIGNGTSDDINTISGGENNQASMWGATIGGGRINVANDTFTVVSGGFSNFAGADLAVIGGGANNSVTGKVGTVAGGFLNQITGDSATIGGGAVNVAGGTKSTISGGFGNLASATYATIGGGQENQSLASHATIAGGQLNIAENPHAFVGGGANNTARGPATVIGGGLVNDITIGSLASSIVGGEGNRLDGSFSVIGGGVSNGLTGSYSVIPGGNSNSVTSDFSWAGGSYAYAVDTCSFVWASCCRDFATGVASPLYSNGTNSFNVRADGGFYFYTDCDTAFAPGVSGVHIPPGGSMWLVGSDRAMKRNMTMVNSGEILEKVSELPIYRWNYKNQDESIEHIGPVAQDFYHIFNIGDNESTIASLDPAGVALAAIKELHSKTLALEAEVAKTRGLREQLDDTNRKVDELVALVSTLLVDRGHGKTAGDLASLNK